MSSKGRIVLPAKLRQMDRIEPGQEFEVERLNASIISTGVTILTATGREGTAAEGQRHGVFTEILLDGLAGGCSDICGNITPAALYSHVDQTLGPWEQRPIYKANVQTFVTLRQVAAKVPLEVLRRLPTYFPDPASIYRLDPSYEEDRRNAADLAHIPVKSDNARVFKELQRCNRHGLVIPVDAEHMYYTAINSTGCRLTAIGAHQCHVDRPRTFSGRIGVCARNRISSSGVSVSGHRALPTCALKAKSFMVPSRLRLRVRPKATSDIRARSSAMFAAGTPTAAKTSHTGSWSGRGLLESK